MKRSRLSEEQVGSVTENCERYFNEPISIFVHVHYLDVWADLAKLLDERVDVPFRLVITSSFPKDRLARVVTPYLVETILIPTQNRGRDIRPFLIAYDRVGGYTIGLKLHTKRSTHLANGDKWRADMLDSLLPPELGVVGIREAMMQVSRIGLVAPQGLFLSMKEWMLDNRKGLKRVAKILSLPTDRQLIRDGYFAAGSMFWFRREALVDIRTFSLLEMFEEEKGQVDGTIAHAIERLFAYAAEQRGFVALPMDTLLQARSNMSEEALRYLSRSRRFGVSMMFWRPSRVHHFVGSYAPFLYAVYRQLPKRFRERLRDRLIGPRP